MTIMDENASDRLQLLVLERRDAQRNMARFYVLAIEPTLFGDVALLREWGRIGSTGCRRLDLHSDPETAVEALDIWLARKVRRGYRIRLGRRGGWVGESQSQFLPTSRVVVPIDQ
jgi:predicted DNA-binding WGR domain protein